VDLADVDADAVRAVRPPGQLVKRSHQPCPLPGERWSTPAWSCGLKAVGPVTHPTADLDEVVHQRVRPGILAILVEANQA
jgi:hypothetical protein